MHPRDRVRIVVATAHAVIDGRLDPAEATAALDLQAEQIAPHLRSDRIDVTAGEAADVAASLRLLAEQVSEVPVAAEDRDELVALAATLGELAQILR